MGSHPGSRSSGRVLDWKGASSIIRAHIFGILKISFNNPALQLPQTDAHYSRTGLILALTKMVTGRILLMRARTATRFKSFFLKLATWDDQDREGSISSPKRRSSWVCSNCLPSKYSERAHSSKRESFCRVPIFMHFVFFGWAAMPWSLVHHRYHHHHHHHHHRHHQYHYNYYDHNHARFHGSGSTCSNGNIYGSIRSTGSSRIHFAPNLTLLSCFTLQS